MTHNQEMLEHHGSKWGDKVRIIGLNIDRDEFQFNYFVKDK
jgi:hypothetical protein